MDSTTPDPLRRLRVAYGDAEQALSSAWASQRQRGPDLQSDGLVGVLDDLLEVLSEELPKIETAFHRLTLSNPRQS